ncbi:MAG: hypothetical protein AAF626_13050 [Pseudomonadota bacterium]
MRQLVLALILCASSAAAQPGYFRVVGVAQNDTLNVRLGPSASTADIGDLSPNEVGVEVLGTDPTGRWGRIIWQDAMGWVSMRFLAPDPQPGIAGTSVPQGLVCGGTEPFWTLRLAQNSARYTDIVGADYTMPITLARVASGRPAWPALLAHAAPPNTTMTTITPALCSDGMSDRDYPYTATVVINENGQQQFVEGCCSLPLGAGNP